MTAKKKAGPKKTAPANESVGYIDAIGLVAEQVDALARTMSNRLSDLADEKDVDARDHPELAALSIMADVIQEKNRTIRKYATALFECGKGGAR